METKDTPKVSLVPMRSARSILRTSSPSPAEDRAGARERIVTAARSHFFRFGFAHCTMDDLASELGMSKKTLYRHFRRKEALVDELITRKSGAMIAGFEEILAAPGLSYAERGARFVRHVLVHLGEINVSFLRDLRRFTPKLYARVEELRAHNVPRFWERLLTAGISAGAVRADIDVPFVARVMLMTMQTLLQPENLERLAAPPPEVMGRFFNLIFAGLLTRAGRTDYENHRASFERPLALH
jgi:AcrR family transcriptional regulator